MLVRNKSNYFRHPSVCQSATSYVTWDRSRWFWLLKVITFRDVSWLTHAARNRVQKPPARQQFTPRTELSSAHAAFQSSERYGSWREIAGCCKWYTLGW